LPNNTALKKRSIKLRGRPTSVALESEFWDYMIDVTVADKCNIQDLVGNIYANWRQPGQSLASACRVFCLENAKTEERIFRLENGRRRRGDD